MAEWCYLIQLYADKGTDKYKIGRTKDIEYRLKAPEYRNAVVYETIQLFHSVQCETEIIRTFRDKFIQVRQDDKGSYGKEYFRGELDEIRKLFKEICSKYVSNQIKKTNNVLNKTSSVEIIPFNTNKNNFNEVQKTMPYSKNLNPSYDKELWESLIFISDTWNKGPQIKKLTYFDWNTRLKKTIKDNYEYDMDGGLLIWS